MHVRVCPECGEEFRPEIVTCSDCGALLRDRHEEEGAAPMGPAAPQEEEAAQAKMAVFYQSNRIADMSPLAERLARESIPFLLQPVQDSFALLVPEADQERATNAVADVLGPSEPLPPFDQETGYLACPACGERLPPRVAECPECGLAVGDGGGD